MKCRMRGGAVCSGWVTEELECEVGFEISFGTEVHKSLMKDYSTSLDEVSEDHPGKERTSRHSATMNGKFVEATSICR